MAEKEKTEKFSVLPREARQSVGVLFKMIFFPTNTINRNFRRFGKDRFEASPLGRKLGNGKR
ncbi:MAG: hypothetical protein PHI77_00490 [Candidatus Pacebacteria bacterium]|nr:hypothetical protein [Candidatus Paceibacterota bacterium]